ncbi:MAG: glycosyltransferase family 39 protein [Candidatus Promineifilaceae bacterium]
MTEEKDSPTGIWTRVVQFANRNPLLLILVITIFALILRFWQLDSVPPGWRDDELINTLAISQKVLDSDLALYYPDASGHEALYHVLSAGLLSLFGPGVAGIRWLPAILGTATVILTYLLASLLFGRRVALLAALTLAVSFWSLMYSRIGIRHISLPLFMLSSFYSFWRGLKKSPTVTVDKEITATENLLTRTSTIWFALAGLFLGIGFYTYFASRGIPIILLLFFFYLALFQRNTLKRNWKGFLVMFGLASILAVPLVVTLMRQPETEARVEELAVPLTEAREGNFAPLGRHIARTLNMFHSDGDDEWLYNIPNRPVFGPVSAAFFWIGFLTALWYATKPVMRYGLKVVRVAPTPSALEQTPHLEGASVFVLIWWLVGISPGFISVPAASLGHTIIAQSAVYVILALPLLPLSNWLQRRFPSMTTRNNALVAAIAGLLLLTIARRDLPDYFIEWPSRGMTRFLYRADIKDLALFLNDREEYNDFGVTGLLAGPWDRIALEIDLEDRHRTAPRWYDPQRAIILQLNGEPAIVFRGSPGAPSLFEELYQPVPGEIAGGFALARIAQLDDTQDDPICFDNGLCLLSSEYHPDDGALNLIWLVDRSLDLPSLPLISNPPPPGVYAGPRLSVFAQIVDSVGVYIVGDDGLWVDVTGLKPGDRFLQQHTLLAPAGSGSTAIIFGLYDPKTGERILTGDGRDHIRLELED